MAGSRFWTLADAGQGMGDWAIGLMSGTALDGIDAALLRSDGVRVLETGPGLTLPYEPGFRAELRDLLGRQQAPADLVEALTLRHAEAVTLLLAQAGMTEADIRVIGFHGQTIWHDPANRQTVQIGDGELLARLSGCPVVDQFRLDDVAAGGEGAPLLPVYHAALAPAGAAGPVAFLNIGGVANLTWIGVPDAAGERPPLIAFDLGPGNALIDDWMLRHTGQGYDADGALAASGQVDADRLARLMAHEYFRRGYPKSLDRDAFDVSLLAGLSAADGAATLSAFTVEAIAAGAAQLPVAPVRWLVCGGGRHNRHLMAGLNARLGVPVEPVEVLGFNGDLIEAQAFAYLALRHLAGLPQTFPGTTGVPRPLAGGQLHRLADIA